MLNKLRERAQGESGFTLIELLVVMLIIGLLAAIAIPSFFNQRDKANDADAKEQVRTAQTAIETYATDNDGDYSGADADALAGIEGSLNDIVDDGRLDVEAADADGYTITATAETTDNTFSIQNASGSLTYDCTGDGGCDGGSWN